MEFFVISLIIIIVIVVIANINKEPVVRKSLITDEEFTLKFSVVPSWYDNNLVHWLSKARSEWIKGNFDSARFAYQKVGYSVAAIEDDDAKVILKEQINFFKTDPWFVESLDLVRSRYSWQKCFIQQEVYAELGDKESVLLLLYYAEKMGLLTRKKFGRTYLVCFPFEHEVSDYSAPNPADVPTWVPFDAVQGFVLARVYYQQGMYSSASTEYQSLYRDFVKTSVIKARKNQILFEDEMFQATIAQFSPTFFLKLSELISKAGKDPVIQSDIYKEFWAYNPSSLSDFFRFADSAGFLDREKSGRSYKLKISARGKRWLKKAV